MTDSRKFRLLTGAAASLVLLVLFTGMLQDSILPELEGYIRRRIYYERVISTKGLGLHEGMYWKEKQ